MLRSKTMRRVLAALLLTAATAFPAAAQATVMVSASGGGVAPQIVSAPRVASSGSGFRWDDAGIGAAVAIALIAGGAASSVAARRRRAQRGVVV
jgi:hypothetical protein